MSRTRKLYQVKYSGMEHAKHIQEIYVLNYPQIKYLKKLEKASEKNLFSRQFLRLIQGTYYLTGGGKKVIQNIYHLVCLSTKEEKINNKGFYFVAKQKLDPEQIGMNISSKEIHLHGCDIGIEPETHKIFMTKKRDTESLDDICGRINMTNDVKDLSIPYDIKKN